MSSLKLITDYKNDDSCRQSFNSLLKLVFKFDLETWYQAGYWNDQYVPYSYIDSGRVVSNVSINKMNVILNHEKRRAIQIGTVMTHPDYRGKHLAADLMDHILDEYKNDINLFFLSAESELAGYYEKFGFKAFKESHFVSDVNRLALRKNGSAVKLDIVKPGTLAFIRERALSRIPVSNVFSVEDFPYLLIFYCMNLFQDCIYYAEKEDVLVLYKEKNNVLAIYDIVSSKPFDIREVLGSIVSENTQIIDFQFTPDLLAIETVSEPYKKSEDLFFVKGDFALAKPFRCHKTAQA